MPLRELGPLGRGGRTARLTSALAIIAVLLSACGQGVVTPSPSLVTVPSAPPSPLPSATVPATATPPPATPTAAVPSRSPIPLPSFAEISAPATRAVWILVGGERLFVSMDSGDTWQERSLPAAGTPSISFITAREGWLAYAGPGLECSQQVPQLWHTTDAGVTFEKVAGTTLPAGQCKDGPSFVDGQRAFMGSWAPGTAPRIFLSGDGGKTWGPNPVPLPDPPGFSATAAGSTLHPGRVRAFGSTLLVAAEFQTTSSGAIYVYRSTDRGATWTSIARRPLPSSLAFVSATRWLELSSPRDSIESTDAGVSFHSFTTDYQQAAPIGPFVIFADDNVGYATVRGTVQRTLDGGAHWTGIRTPGT